MKLIAAYPPKLLLVGAVGGFGAAWDIRFAINPSATAWCRLTPPRPPCDPAHDHEKERKRKSLRVTRNANETIVPSLSPT